MSSAPRDPPAPSTPFRWKRAEDTDDRQPALFPDETAVERHLGKGEYRGMEFLHVRAKRIINAVPKESQVPFQHTINAYRGCSHACVYCFARPTHKYLGLDIGTDFDTKIVVKVNAVERLRAELRHPRWGGNPIAMGTNTDPYQKAEGRYHLTKRIVRTLAEAANPFSILTKSTLILRDIELLSEAASTTNVQVNFSIGTLDREVWRLTEPGTPPPDKRVEAVRRLNEAGIPCGVLIAPILPGLSDSDDHLHDVIDACVGAGAASVTGIGLHLRGDVRTHFFDWLTDQRPDLEPLYRARFGRRAYQSRATSDDLRARMGTMITEARRRHGAGPQPVRRSPPTRSGRHRQPGGSADPPTSSQPQLELFEGRPPASSLSPQGTPNRRR